MPAFGAVALSVVLSNGFPPPFYYYWYGRSSSVVATNVSDSKTNFVILSGSVVSNLTTTYTLRPTNRAQPLFVASNSASFTLTVVPDTDLDGMPDSYELTYSGSATAFDPAGDLDHDGMSNLAEYLAGTDPNDPNSYLRVDQTITPGTATVNLGAISNKTYTVQFTDALPAVWQKLTDVASRPSNRVDVFTDPAWTPRRFYRIVTPRQP